MLWELREGANLMTETIYMIWDSVIHMAAHNFGSWNMYIIFKKSSIFLTSITPAPIARMPHITVFNSKQTLLCPTGGATCIRLI